MSFDGTLDSYTAAGGANYFAYTLATLLSIQPYQVEVFSAKQGSIIIIFKVYSVSSDPTMSADDIKTLIAAQYAAGNLNIYGTQIKSSPSSAIISLTGCNDGYYLDSTSVCRVCPDGCDTCTSAGDECKDTNVGAIVGGVIGGIAFVVIVVIIYLKREAIKNLVSPKAYNKVASTPTNAAQKA
jgi:hypothetical protein